MQSEPKITSRRKILFIGASIISGLSFLSFGLFTSKKKQTVKMLTQEGKLVEVDKRWLTGKKGKISNSELMNWIKTK